MNSTIHKIQRKSLLPKSLKKKQLKQKIIQPNPKRLDELSKTV